MEKSIDVSRWYVIFTKPKEEDRVEQNLTAWGIETFSPKIRKEQINVFTGKAVYYRQSLFSRYLFARFDVNNMLHKIGYTRGVQKVVSFNNAPLAVEDEIVSLIQSRVGEDGFVRLSTDLTHGDQVLIGRGSMTGIKGIFDRTMNDNRRVKVLLETINYQGSIIVERNLVSETQRLAVI
jgi:transcriptional antiterminator RfaH